MSLQHAFRAEDPLHCLDQHVGFDTDEQRLFHLLFTALLTVSAYGVSDLFVRFDGDDLARLLAGCKRIGARRVSSSLGRLDAYLIRKLGRSYSFQDVVELLEEDGFSSLARSADGDRAVAALEMEERLLRYARQNLAELEAPC
jgi:hypothetical protein